MSLASRSVERLLSNATLACVRRRNVPTVPEPVAPGSVPISQLHAGPGPRDGLVTSGPNSFSISEVFSSAHAFLAFAGSAPAGAATAAATAHPRTTLVSARDESLPT